MGEVFLARLEREEGFTRQVAIKRILPGLSGDPMFRQMFAAEARLSASLQHPNIVQVLDFGHEGDTYYLVMEFVDGADLATVMAGAKYDTIRDDLDFCLSTLFACVRALRHAHSQDPVLVHGDVCPANVLIGRHGEVKLTDFGLVRMRGKGRGIMAGHLAYMAPEVAMGHGASCASDQFSLGAMVIEMLTGKGPYPGTCDQAKAMELARRGQLIDIRSALSGMHSGLISIMEKMLQVDPGQRFDDMQELLQSLEVLVQGLSLSVDERSIEKAFEKIAPKMNKTLQSTPSTIVAGQETSKPPEAPQGSYRKTMMILFAVTMCTLMVLAYLYYRPQENSRSVKIRAEPGPVPEHNSIVTGPPRKKTEPMPHHGQSPNRFAGATETSLESPLVLHSKALGNHREKKHGFHNPRTGSNTRHGEEKAEVENEKSGIIISTSPGTKWALGGSSMSGVTLSHRLLAKGNHVLKIRRGDLSATIRIEYGAEQEPVSISVQTKPYAIVKLDKIPKGTSPLGGLKLGSGTHTLRLVAGTSILELNMIVP